MSGFAQAFADAALYPVPPLEPAAAEVNAEPAERPTAATKLVRMAESRYRLGITPDKTPFASESAGSRQHIAFDLKGDQLGLRAALAADYFDIEGKAASAAALADAMAVLEGKARRLDPTPLASRYATAEGALWIDSGRTDGTVFKVTPQAVEMVGACPVMFQRTELTGEMPMPVGGGTLDELWQFLNVAPSDRPLLLAAMVTAMRQNTSYPIITFTGEQGTGKSTAARSLVQLLDPSPLELRPAPRHLEVLVHSLTSSWVAAFDNLSAMPGWLSDALCMASTGGADMKRSLYSNKGITLSEFKRPVILTGIDFAGLRGDLSERLLQVELHRIPDHARRDEASMRERWEAARPRILGALLKLAQQVQQGLPDVRLDTLPRMADYVRVLGAIDRLHGTTGRARYLAQAAEIAADTLTASPFTEHLLGMKLDVLETAGELLERVRPGDPEWRAPREWPKNARAVTTLLRRDAPALRKNGWTVDDMGDNRTGTKQWHVRHPEHECRHGL